MSIKTMIAALALAVITPLAASAQEQGKAGKNKKTERWTSFAKNAKKEGLYGGYLADGALSGGRTVKVEDGHYYAMGDNSYNSLDSRYWGQVPARALVGKSLIIFYPFTSRWGATK